MYHNEISFYVRVELCLKCEILIDKEYNRYCLTNLEEKLTETKFKSLFKDRVKLMR